MLYKIALPFILAFKLLSCKSLGLRQRYKHCKARRMTRANRPLRSLWSWSDGSGGWRDYWKKCGYRSIISLFFVVFAVFVRGDAEFLFELFYKIGKGVVTRFGANFERGH